MSCVSQQYSPTYLVAQGPGTSWSQGGFWPMLAVSSRGCGIVLFLLLVSALVGETGLQACAGFLWEEPVPAHGWVEWLLALCGPGCVTGRVSRWLWVRKCLGSISFDEWDCAPPSWLFGLRCLNTGAYNRQLGEARRWCQDPKQDVYRQSEFKSLWILPDMSAASFYDPRESHPTPYLLRRPSSSSWEVWPRLLQSHCFCSQSSCVHPPRVEFLFSSVLRSSCSQAPLAFKAKCSADSSLQCQTPRLESLGWAQSSHSFGRTSVI